MPVIMNGAKIVRSLGEYKKQKEEEFEKAKKERDVEDPGQTPDVQPAPVRPNINIKEKVKELFKGLSPQEIGKKAIDIAFEIRKMGLKANKSKFTWKVFKDQMEKFAKMFDDPLTIDDGIAFLDGVVDGLINMLNPSNPLDTLLSVLQTYNQLMSEGFRCIPTDRKQVLREAGRVCAPGAARMGKKAWGKFKWKSVRVWNKHKAQRRNRQVPNRQQWALNQESHMRESRSRAAAQSSNAQNPTPSTAQPHRETAPRRESKTRPRQSGRTSDRQNSSKSSRMQWLSVRDWAELSFGFRVLSPTRR